MNQLEHYGMSPDIWQEGSLYPELQMGRVISQSKELYRVVTEVGEIFAEVSGKLRYGTRFLSDYPVVGDFVMMDRSSDVSGNAIIHRILQRKSCFQRTAVGYKNQAQVIAANIDTVFICMSLNNDYNPRRLERYLSIAWNSGAVPVVVLTKSDLGENLDEKLVEIEAVAIGAEVLVTSKLDEQSWHQLMPYIRPGTTASFIGSSGVGKSTLINQLAGKEIFATNDIRKDDKGRHTTTRRELLLLPSGGVVIDTPGMRELGVEQVDLSRSFADIDGLTEHCQFKDCLHNDHAKGCALRAAVEKGELDEKRLENYLKLKKEARYDGLSSRQIETEKINTMFSDFGGIKNARKYAKEKNKKRY